MREKKLNRLNEQEIYVAAIDTFGRDSQMRMVIEECAELIKDINKVFRNKLVIDDLAKEVADVQIMINQLKIIINNDEKIDKIKKEKLEKLEKLIEAGHD